MVALVERQAVLVLLLGALCLASLGCGHPATRAECEEIFDRSAEIELRAQNVTSPADLQERVAKARADKGDELMKQCVGKRITERAMKCVRGAQSTRELEACLM